MNAKTLSSPLLILLPAMAIAADFTDTAPVISATPVIERVYEPRQECWYETVSAYPQYQGAQYQDRSLGGPIVGGVAGGIIGNQVGKGSGNKAAIAVGAATGAVVGDRVGNPYGGERSYGGSVIGGLAGAIIGNQVGKGSGNKAAIALGAVTGAIVGDRLDNRYQPAYSQQAYSQPQQIQRCKQVDAYRDVLKGYTVVYRYNGKDIVTTMPYNPGSTVRIGIGVIDGGSAPISSYRY